MMLTTLWESKTIECDKTDRGIELRGRGAIVINGYNSGHA